MSVTSGPTLVTSGLIFSLDAANIKSTNPASATKVSGAKQLVRNLMKFGGETITTDTNLRLTGPSFFTAVAIDYPESSNGGTVVGRNGLTPGFYDLSSAKTYDSSRALHLWVWNNDTSSWIADSYFSGYRLSGHCYDTYAGADAPGGYTAELDRFAANFNTIKTAFPNCTYIVMGSHRDSYRNSTVRAILYDLGLPTGTALDNDYIANGEWILLGKPGLGAGNSYGWVYENNDANSAVMTFGLGNMGNPTNYISFDGSTNYINVARSDLSGGSWAYSNVTICAWIYIDPTSSTGDNNIGTVENSWEFRWNNNNNGTSSLYFASNPWAWIGSGTVTNGVWQMITFRHGASTGDFFSNTTLLSSTSISGSLGAGTATYPHMTIMARSSGAGSFAKGRLGTYHVYNRAITDAEIAQNFNAFRGRYGV